MLLAQLLGCRKSLLILSKLFRAALSDSPLAPVVSPPTQQARLIWRQIPTSQLIRIDPVRCRFSILELTHNQDTDLFVGGGGVAPGEAQP